MCKVDQKFNRIKSLAYFQAALIKDSNHYIGRVEMMMLKLIWDSTGSLCSTGQVYMYVCMRLASLEI